MKKIVGLLCLLFVTQNSAEALGIRSSERRRTMQILNGLCTDGASDLLATYSSLQSLCRLQRSEFSITPDQINQIETKLKQCGQRIRELCRVFGYPKVFYKNKVFGFNKELDMQRVNNVCWLMQKCLDITELCISADFLNGDSKAKVYNAMKSLHGRVSACRIQKIKEFSDKIEAKRVWAKDAWVLNKF
ncbi:hypothetical protein KAT92_02135 [Candidatus Babeliales bacterium]|nr:hypothetical protein [Candidatus Babeliales bacterium]